MYRSLLYSDATSDLYRHPAYFSGPLHFKTGCINRVTAHARSCVSERFHGNWATAVRAIHLSSMHPPETLLSSSSISWYDCPILIHFLLLWRMKLDTIIHASLHWIPSLSSWSQQQMPAVAIDPVTEQTSDYLINQTHDYISLSYFFQTPYMCTYII